MLYEYESPAPRPSSWTCAATTLPIIDFMCIWVIQKREEMNANKWNNNNMFFFKLYFMIKKNCRYCPFLTLSSCPSKSWRPCTTSYNKEMHVFDNCGVFIPLFFCFVLFCFVFWHRFAKQECIYSLKKTKKNTHTQKGQGLKHPLCPMCAHAWSGLSGCWGS